jgi:dUTP pyrophosphatase
MLKSSSSSSSGYATAGSVSSSDFGSSLTGRPMYVGQPSNFTNSVNYFKVKLLTSTSKCPTRTDDGAAGWDIYANETVKIVSNGIVSVASGIALSIPRGHYCRIAPRSGLAKKFGIDTLAGVVDSSYRGHVEVILVNHGKEDYVINQGDRIAQMIIEKCNNEITPLVVTELDKTTRNENGFGSSGK